MEGERGNNLYNMVNKSNAPFSSEYIQLFNSIWNDMAISYREFWKFLIDRDILKKDLQKKAGHQVVYHKTGEKRKRKYRHTQKDFKPWIAISLTLWR